MPITMYEGLPTNIDRCVQLSSFAASGEFYVRTLGSLDSENFFGTFQDVDPKGQGVLMPGDVPAAIDTIPHVTSSNRRWTIHRLTM